MSARYNHTAMSDASSIPTPPLRYDLRAMLVVTTAVAGLAAVTGAILRYLPQADHAYFLTLWGLMLGGLLAVHGLRWRQRRREVTAAGQIRFVLRQTRLLRTAWRHLPLFWMVALFWPLSVLYQVVETALLGDSGPFRRPQHVSEAIIGGLILSAVTCIGTARLVDFIGALRAVRLCDEGVLTGNRFLPWHAISLVRRDAMRGNWLQFLTWSPSWRCEVVLPAPLPDGAEALVREKSCLVDQPSL